MNTIVFIETTKSGSSREAIKAAERLGYFTVLLTERKKFIMQRKEFSDVYQMIHLKELTEELIKIELKKLQQQGNIIKAIVSFVDPYVSIAAKLTTKYCEAEISVNALKIMEDKTLTREMLVGNETSPKFEIYHPTDNFVKFVNKKHNFPLIIKSPISKASKDVYLVKDHYELEKVMKDLLTLYPDKKILIEEYLEGPQYIVEALIHNREVNIVAIIKQEITRNLKFIVTGYEIQLNLENLFFKKLYHAVKSILNDLEVHNAACHLELRLVNNRWMLIEINPRISGGAMNRIIEEAYGINLVEETLKLYLGQQPSFIKRYENYIYTHYITIGSHGNLIKVVGRQKASQQPGVREVYIKPRRGAIMAPPISMGNRYGYVIATGNTSCEAKTNAINAANKIKFYLEPK